jgi:hypothetical protein
MKVSIKRVSYLRKVEWIQGLSFSNQKIPCEDNCPYMVITDTLNCRKESEGLVDMEEVRGAGKCLFGACRDPEAA